MSLGGIHLQTHGRGTKPKRPWWATATGEDVADWMPLCAKKMLRIWSELQKIFGVLNKMGRRGLLMVNGQPTTDVAP